MVLRLLPRDQSFFDLFNEAAANVLQAARLLHTLLEDYQDVQARSDAIKRLEDVGDDLTHRIIDRLNRTFVTPLDREDIYDLAKQLDNVIDWIEAGAARLWVYRVERPTENARRLGEIIVHIAQAVATAVAQLAATQRLDAPLEEIHRLENLADRVQRDGVALLFSGETDAITVIKWKDIYDTLEEATDQAEDVANVLEGIKTKYS